MTPTLKKTRKINPNKAQSPYSTYSIILPEDAPQSSLYSFDSSTPYHKNEYDDIFLQFDHKFYNETRERTAKLWQDRQNKQEIKTEYHTYTNKPKGYIAKKKKTEFSTRLLHSSTIPGESDRLLLIYQLTNEEVSHNTQIKNIKNAYSVMTASEDYAPGFKPTFSETLEWEKQEYIANSYQVNNLKKFSSACRLHLEQKFTDINNVNLDLFVKNCLKNNKDNDQSLAGSIYSGERMKKLLSHMLHAVGYDKWKYFVTLCGLPSFSDIGLAYLYGFLALDVLAKILNDENITSCIRVEVKYSGLQKVTKKIINHSSIIDDLTICVPKYEPHFHFLVDSTTIKSKEHLREILNSCQTKISQELAYILKSFPKENTFVKVKKKNEKPLVIAKITDKKGGIYGLVNYLSKPIFKYAGASVGRGVEDIKLILEEKYMFFSLGTKFHNLFKTTGDKIKLDNKLGVFLDLSQPEDQVYYKKIYQLNQAKYNKWNDKAWSLPAYQDKDYKLKITSLQRKSRDLVAQLINKGIIKTGEPLITRLNALLNGYHLKATSFQQRFKEINKYHAYLENLLLLELSKTNRNSLLVKKLFTYFTGVDVNRIVFIYDDS